VTFQDKLRATAARNRSLLCVGLDPDQALLPACVRDRDNPTLHFLKQVIDATADLVCAYKPNFAFFGALGERGWPTLKATLEHIPPSVPVLLDAKVGDIGNTAEQYARMFFAVLGADALTVNPYMGHDAVAPFLAYPDKGVFLLCLTSNQGAEDFAQQQLADGPLYLRVARKAVEWNAAGNCGLVVGATQPGAFSQLRQLAPDLPFLVPGVGAQGGDLEAVVRSGADGRGGGLLVNASRAVLYASAGADFAEAARRAAQRLRQRIEACRAT
jgi:orotidine-5'-phosphate decarboxylase